MADHSLAVPGKDVFDPGQQRTDFGVHTWVVWLSTALTPRHDSLQLAITHQGAARVTLNHDKKKKKTPLRSACYSSLVFK